MNHISKGSLLGTLLVLSLSASATSPITGSLATSSTVSNVCKINSTQNISLGVYTPSTGTPLLGSGQISLTCTKGDAVSILPISGGSSLKGSSGALSYALYTSSALTQTWGATAATKSINFASNSYDLNWGKTATTSTLAECMALSPDSAVLWGGYAAFGNTCFYDLLASSSGSVYNMINQYQGLNVGGTSVLTALGSIHQSTVYVPSATLVSGTTYLIPIGTSTANPLTATSTSVATPLVLTYYANVPGTQDVPPGAYLDTVTLQVTF